MNENHRSPAEDAEQVDPDRALRDHRSACSCQTPSPTARQVNSEPRSSPMMDSVLRSSSSPSTRSMASPSSPGYAARSAQGMDTPASPATSTSEGVAAWMTGTASAMASSMGDPNSLPMPGYTSAVARL